jgi:16S rRNA (adenine1518-N6/adenine1519-N6)-dimethyltransferase
MRPKKHLGQHFLTAPTFARKIADAVPARQSEKLLEIGPGQGALSIFLKERFPQFHLVEVDPAAIEVLQPKLGDGYYTIHRNDILCFDFSEAGFPLHVVGNLPYSIGALIIKKVLLQGNSIASCTFMVQREVAERIVSAPHNKTYGFLSVFCSFFGKPKLLFHVPPGAFFPRPKVDSSVFQIIIEPDLERKLSCERWEPFFAFVSKGFQQRRKTLVNALSDSVGQKERLAAVLQSMEVNVNARPEDCGCDEWLELFKRL